jgi:glycosyltransferase involved in cell wall biosynthesis
VLLSAFSCNPESGSEAGVGWSRALETARYFDTWVLCGEDEAAIRRWFTLNGEIPNLHFCFVPIYRSDRLLAKVPGLLYFAYRVWQRRAYRIAVELNRKIHFDIVHQYNIATYREPGDLWKLGLPFIWGPIGGIQNFPWRFLPHTGIRGALKEGGRSILNWLQFRLSRRIRKAIKKAAAVITVNSQNKRDFQKIYGIKPILMLEVGSKEVKEVARHHEPNRPLKILWSGVFEYRKALDLVILALSKLPKSIAYELRILGDGPLRVRWQALARRAGVEPHCTWIGWIPQVETIKQYDWADVFVFSSLRDSFGTVVMEALSRGVPVICLDHQGVGDVVTAQCGIKIPVTSPDKVVQSLADAIISLAKNRERLDELAVAALERAREYLWARKIEQTAAIYQQVLTKRLDNTKLSPAIFREVA